ncbi:MAG: hypothetical protein H6566_27930 [Lewinellaceae bacterium]|nr:hypothetical protein [Lewinellaceae bacterium]
MRIEVSGVGRALLTKKATGLELQIPIALHTSERETGLSLESIEQTIGDKKLAELDLLDAAGQEVQRLPLLPNTRNGLSLRAGKLPEGLIDLAGRQLSAELEFKFLSENGAETLIPFVLTAKLTDTTEAGQYALSDIHLKRTARTTFFLNLVLFALLILILNLWASQNNDVYNQLLPSFPSSIILTFIAVFLGINLPELKNIFSSLRAAKDFFNTSEFYFQRDTIRLLNSRLASGVLLGGTGLAAYLFLWLLFPVSLDSGNEAIVPFAPGPQPGEYQLVKNKKAYWKDLHRLKYSLRPSRPQQAYPASLFEVASTPDISIPLQSFWDAASVRSREKRYQIDASFIGCYRFEGNENTYTISQIARKCEEEQQECFCRILAFIQDNNTEDWDGESDIVYDKGVFKDRNNLTGLTEPATAKRLQPVLFRLSQIEENEFQPYGSPIDNPFIKALGEEVAELNQQGYGLTRDTLIRFINNSYQELADDYGGTVDVNKPLYARRLNGIWAFCGYLDYLCREIQLEDYQPGALQLSGPAEEMQNKFLGTGIVAQAHLKFLLLARNKLKVDKMEVDSLLGRYISKTGTEKRLDLLLKILSELEVEPDEGLAALLLAQLKTLPLAGARPTVRENVDRLMESLFWISANSQDDGLKNKYYNAFHQYLVEKDEQNAALDIAILYLEQLGRNGINPSEEQLQYFEEKVCSKWGAGKRENAPPYKAIITKDRKGPVSPKLMARATAWDSPEYLDICQQRRVSQ